VDDSLIYRVPPISGRDRPRSDPNFAAMLQPARPRLAGLTTAVPSHALDQSDVVERVRLLFSSMERETIERLLGMFDNAGIDCRYSCVPIDWYSESHAWRDRNALYLEHAVTLLERAARECLATSRTRPDDVDAIVVVSSTGIATPTLDALLINRLGLRSDVRRLPIFGLGCAGGVLGLSRAVDLVRLDPNAKVLFLTVELCALCFRKDDTSKSNFVATALFGDGAAAALISGSGDGPAFGAAGEHTWPNSLDIMGWDVEEDGLKARFSRDIPNLARTELRAVTAAFLTRHGLDFGDIQHFVCHPGGAKVLIAIEDAFGLAPGTLVESRSVLRDFGNMSAVTVLFVLDRMLKAGARGRMLMTALGPGFSAGFQILEAA